MSGGVCSVNGCEQRIRARGLCSRHYYRAYSNGTLDDHPVKAARPFVPVCVCDNPQPDGLGECARCRMGYTPGLAACRAEWRAYLKLSAESETSPKGVPVAPSASSRPRPVASAALST